jgi:hypothetical protein
LSRGGLRGTAGCTKSGTQPIPAGTSDALRLAGVPSGDRRPGCPEIDEIEAAEIHGDSPVPAATPSGGVKPDRYCRRRSGSGLGPVWRRGYGAKLGSWKPAGVAVLAGIYITRRMSDNRHYRTYDRRVRQGRIKKAYYTDRPQTGNLTSWTWLTATTSLGPCLHPPGGPPHGSRGAVAALAHVLGRGDANPSLASQVQKYPGIRGSGLGEQP